MIYRLLRPLLFQLDPERAHALSLYLARLGGVFAPALRLLFARPDPALRTTAFGLAFDNPLGLAAGYDKNGVATRGLLALGFGHVELGTLTRFAQEGNPKPRVHRIPESRAVINALGFPNEGINAFLARYSAQSRAKLGGIVGINVGKSKATPLEDAAVDYAALIALAAPVADYITVNISSPNTPGLRALQHGVHFDALLTEIARARERANQIPILVKVAPDLEPPALDALVDAVIAHGLSGIIATNTTLSRDGVPATFAHVSGGLSGAPLTARSLNVVTRVATRARGRIALVAAGGISTQRDLTNVLAAGADLAQMYTALIYEGPSLPGRLAKALTALCKEHRCESLVELREKLMH